MIALYVPLSLQQIEDTDGKPIRTARLYVYDTGTTTPKDVFATRALDPARMLPWPVPVDASGRLPPVWVGQGDYDVIVTDGTSPDPVGAPGAVLFSVQGLPGDPVEAPAPAYDPLRQIATGMIGHFPGPTTPNGWVPANGGTIGNPNSGASVRADADCSALFAYLWEGRSDLVVSPGRGADAATDFAAGNTIALPDMNSRFPVYLASGSGTGNLLSGGLITHNPGTLIGSAGGEATHIITPNELTKHAHLATFAGNAVLDHTHLAASGVDTPGHKHVNGVVRKQVISATASSGAIPVSWYAFPDGEGVGASNPTSDPDVNHTHAIVVEPAGAFTPSGEVTIAETGASAPHNNLPPFVVAGYAFLKL